MAVCDWCEREMTTAESCTVTALHQDGLVVDMITWGGERGWAARARCGDCNVMPGRFHHPGCDVQQCPVCCDQMMGCECRFDEDGLDGEEDVYFDSNGCLTERVWRGDQQVIIHYDDVPQTDLTTVRGIPCTTALRTVIDIAPEVDREHLKRIVDDCLRRKLFSVEEAHARLAQDDMRARPGALLLREVLLSG